MEDHLPKLPPRPLSGIITKIRLENFMCHSSLEIEFGEWVNFITGQNGSGKSAILTALCVAFGCRARGTQRASTLKDFIKTGCSHAVVHVEVKNQGEDAFKPEIYGDLIIIERRISESTSSTVLKDHQGKKVASRKEDLHELVEHFNIDVENPCVIMSQDKSREFLHSGNDKEKFKFFFKATLLQQVSDLLQDIGHQLGDANAQVDELENSIKPIEKELKELQEKIKSMEHVEEISQKLQDLRKKLAWSWVYEVDKKIEDQAANLEKWKERIPTCEVRIKGQLHEQGTCHHVLIPDPSHIIEKDLVEELKGRLLKKKAQISSMMEKTSEVRRLKEELHQNLSMATKERLELEEEHSHQKNLIEKLVKRFSSLEKQVTDIQEQDFKSTQWMHFRKACLRILMGSGCAVLSMGSILLVDSGISAVLNFFKDFLLLCCWNLKLCWIVSFLLWLGYVRAEECQMEEELKGLQDVVDSANIFLTRMKEEESALWENLSDARNTIESISAEDSISVGALNQTHKLTFGSAQATTKREPIVNVWCAPFSKIDLNDRKCREISFQLREIQQHQTDKVTGFGGDRVIYLLREIERHHNRFTMPPIGPIGSHVKLEADVWAVAVEHAIGKLLNAFIVTNHKDSLLLRACAKEVRYNHLQILIYDFRRPRLTIPNHMLPSTPHPTTFSVISSDNPTVENVLVDMAHAERQVLVKDYEVGKSVAFGRRIPNLKEVFTSDGHKMFSRGSVETTLPPNRRIRAGRLSCSFDDQIMNFEQDASMLQDHVRQARGRKRAAEEAFHDLKARHNNVKGLNLTVTLYCRSNKPVKRRECAEKDLIGKQLTLQDLKNSWSAEASVSSASNVDELCQEISKIQDEIQEKESHLASFRVVIAEAEAKAKDLKVSFEKLCESTKVDIDAFEEAEQELTVTEDAFVEAEKGKSHYEQVMQEKVVPAIKKAETQLQKLQVDRQENCKKASIICSESEVETLGGCTGSTPEQLTAQINRLKQRLQQESRRHADSIDDLRELYEKKYCKIIRKQKTYKAFREKLEVCQNALALRLSKLQRNATYLRRQLTWQFNGHLGKKGISGHTKVNYEHRTLSVEVKMPQDASSSIVRDTRGLSGGERSFSTLCFALALHEMTEAPFRAMDEFDVFMDAVSRKISLDTLVDFALAHGSQWIFITPHDIRAGPEGNVPTLLADGPLGFQGWKPIP
ncbi:hypothetical protein IFM89_027533 [Coptis chinensis]|uniref:RecF/RecN/SMC N-terminal domain-containing protein n=1 Tax=Coptis chinensis TaxID=261450 RepID=A0A835HPV8_9MAGN|nr:hypothetical protein IFM89_027533 [Coptis chinensis]